ncbi:MAG: acyl-CoA dehydrogenase [Acidobacteria bacterium]|nr:acyl-CoA dehydrogenase [Acidobacteriota bacterium]MSO62414.1 acyl-CoA dehydrogenase [Acidobacteriota bacterium]
MAKGGSWLIEETAPASVMTPEKITEEHRLIRQAASEFIAGEVMPANERLEQKDWQLQRELIKKCGELGLFGTNIPETYGGVDLDKISTLVVSEELASHASFGATFGAQANLTILPIYMFGTEAQKQKYLPGLVSGEVVGAYCLSESGSGSDAMGAKTRAMKQADGSFIMSGEKMWITNGGFADVFIVFAKVDGEHFTAFIVERNWAGVSSGKEEHKLGLHGSSTTPVILQDVKVPADAVLGAIGKGHKVAFNVLNFGRFKLGAMCSGGAKAAIGEAAKYALSRKQFGVAIATFGAIKHKLGEMTARQYALESMMYRTAGLIDQRIAGAANQKADDPAPMLQALEEFAVEASIAKVLGSETVDYVIDENLQIHGGNGFVHDYPAEGHYRDARVNRIFEGTNEINRLLIPGMLMKKALKGELPLLAAAKQLQDEIMSPSMAMPDGSDEPLTDEARACGIFKKVVLLVAGTAMQTYGTKLEQEQEVLSYLADILIDTYAAESAVLRAQDAAARKVSNADAHADAARVATNEAAGRIELAARSCLAAMAEGDTLRTQLAALRRLMKVTPVNTVIMRRRLADATVAKGSYIF